MWHNGNNGMHAMRMGWRILLAAVSLIVSYCGEE